MLKKWIFYSSLTLIIAYLSSGFKPFDSQNHNWFQSANQKEMSYSFPSQEEQDYANLNVPFTGKFFIGFKEAVAFKESQGKYHKVNSLGYMGKYQFGLETLQTIGIHDSVAFLNNPKLQEKAFVALLSKNKWELKDEIEKFSGKIISGVKITESGILAAAHLGGAGSVKRFLNSNGAKKCKDDYGTSVKSYMRDFGGYETSGIIADNDAKVK
ncbi:peptidoglycan-binding protein LysM [Flavobacterium sp.]|uniref:peptidoglycan-binding protein LysM n=1 Tax=Flavobacterium sp. TaxID=239 RepID=UPI00286AFB49|nr:peptidoglycan-binding protein LysM [Flavobacterium sp.]